MVIAKLTPPPELDTRKQQLELVSSVIRQSRVAGMLSLMAMMDPLAV